MENSQIKVLILLNQTALITEIEEVTSELGEPDCKLIRPYRIEYQDSVPVLSPFLGEYTNQPSIMMSSDKILTLIEPNVTLLEKYKLLIK